MCRLRGWKVNQIATIPWLGTLYRIPGSPGSVHSHCRPAGVHDWLRKRNPPDWQPLERVLEAFKLSKDRRGRKSYLSWLEARAAEHGGGINEQAMQALRNGWYLAEEEFKDKLLGLLDKTFEKIRGKNSHAGDAVRAHHQGEAERILSILAEELGLPESREELNNLKKSDPRKVICAALVKRRTAVSNDWITERLAMGHPASMSQHVNRMRRERKAAKLLKRHEKTLKSKD